MTIPITLPSHGQAAALTAAPAVVIGKYSAAVMEKYTTGDGALPAAVFLPQPGGTEARW